jgi:glycosyltransferase involved in cell wall biosynthesis
MKILHVTPHLGGGVGKALAAISTELPQDAEQIFLLLEEPRDRRYANLIETGGASVIVARNLDHVAALAAEADIVQFEFWNHPRLFECLARSAFPALRSVFWAHISGLSRPVIQPGLIKESGRFVFTTRASLSIPSLAILPAIEQKKIAVINSGFGFVNGPRPAPAHGRKPIIAYLGTVDFVKMDPGFFDAIDRLDGGDIQVSVWGDVDPSGVVAARARAMRHPERIRFGGQTSEPAAALSCADIFFYPLQPDHYGTAENALVEAMSLGLIPVVLNNPAEKAIVRHGETGFVAQSIEECVELLQLLLSSPDLRERISGNAIHDVTENRTAASSAQKFLDLWHGLLEEPPRLADFRGVVGNSPADWFLATQCLPGEPWVMSRQDEKGATSKGTIGHFESAFRGDASLAVFADGQGRSATNAAVAQAKSARRGQIQKT